MPDPIRATLRAYSRKLDRDLDKAVGQAQFALRNREECPTCGATLQGTRCPWSRTGDAPNAAGLTYCTWPRGKRNQPQYQIAFSRRGAKGTGQVRG